MIQFVRMLRVGPKVLSGYPAKYPDSIGFVDDCGCPITGGDIRKAVIHESVAAQKTYLGVRRIQLLSLTAQGGKCHRGSQTMIF